jgi:hypothetical protein
MQLRSAWSYQFLIMGDAAAVVICRPNPAELARELSAPHAWVTAVGADAAAATVAGAALWLVAAWLGVGLGAGLLARLPGTVGRCAGVVTRVVLPDVLYRVVAGATGLGLVLVPTGAHAQPLVPTPAWPTSAPATVPPDAPAGGPAVRGPAPPAQQQPHVVTVRPGDSLWSIASRRLGPGATDSAITSAWRRIYATNRRVVGPDPGLIRPGQRLSVDPASGRSS